MTEERNGKTDECCLPLSRTSSDHTSGLVRFDLFVFGPCTDRVIFVRAIAVEDPRSHPHPPSHSRSRDTSVTVWRVLWINIPLPHSFSPTVSKAEQPIWLMPSSLSLWWLWSLFCCPGRGFQTFPYPSERFHKMPTLTYFLEPVWPRGLLNFLSGTVWPRGLDADTRPCCSAGAREEQRDPERDPGGAAGLRLHPAILLHPHHQTGRQRRRRAPALHLRQGKPSAKQKKKDLAPKAKVIRNRRALRGWHIRVVLSWGADTSVGVAYPWGVDFGPYLVDDQHGVEFMESTEIQASYGISGISVANLSSFSLGQMFFVLWRRVQPLPAPTQGLKF